MKVLLVCAAVYFLSLTAVTEVLLKPRVPQLPEPAVKTLLQARSAPSAQQERPVPRAWAPPRQP